MSIFTKIRDNISKIALGRKIEVIAMLIGLTVDVITLLSFIGILVTPPSSPNFYVNSQEFLVWSLLALIYSLGFLNSFVLRRWRKIYRENLNENQRFPTFRAYREEMFSRHYALSWITTFPFTYLYTRALIAAIGGETVSPWWAFVITVILLSWIIALVMVGVGRLFDTAFRLFSGEGDIKHEIKANSSDLLEQLLDP